MIHVDLTKQKREWTYDLICKMNSSGNRFDEGEEWRRNGEPSSPIACGMTTRRIELPYPLLGVNFELFRVSDAYGIATNVYSRADDTFRGLTGELLSTFFHGFKLFFISTSPNGAGYILKSESEKEPLGAITEFQNLREISIGFGGASQLNWVEQEDFRINVGRLMRYTTSFIEDVRINYEKRTGKTLKFPDLNLVIP